MPADEEHHIVVHLDRLLDERGMTLTELAEKVGVTLANLSILKNGRARAIRFSTLSAICTALDCQPGDILSNAP
ncbi:helix-turn-helix domain-containing protein [Bailinhaonella thermotolerans]|uniref:Transcriptional regulator n=1 Tax=Bailinhaonella thermotolerans TaxID=1070861 RepID=A0A3A4BGV6_9ACTN|nr:helix-turn-helix transcriptional regulator [Bailinhaonella thermotolerans]RJL30522.1 transcriptional regulator [Bailinhaonella thermotolerans]